VSRVEIESGGRKVTVEDDETALAGLAAAALELWRQTAGEGASSPAAGQMFITASAAAAPPKRKFQAHPRLQDGDQ
jgi:hypothetical protein